MGFEALDPAILKGERAIVSDTVPEQPLLRPDAHREIRSSISPALPSSGEVVSVVRHGTTSVSKNNFDFQYLEHGLWIRLITVVEGAEGGCHESWWRCLKLLHQGSIPTSVL